MKNFLTTDETKLIETEIRSFEEKTGCELLVVVADSCDDYPAASLRFGLFTAFGILLLFSYFFEFEQAFLWPVTFFILTLLMTWVGQMNWAKKLGLSEIETNRECTEKAIELFHTLGTSRVSHKVTAMILVSAFEHQIEVLVDEKLKSKISQPELDELVQIMQGHFRQGHRGQGFVSSIQSLGDKVIKDFGGKVSDVAPGELKDTIIFIKQERYDRPL